MSDIFQGLSVLFYTILMIVIILWILNGVKMDSGDSKKYWAQKNIERRRKLGKIP